MEDKLYERRLKEVEVSIKLVEGKIHIYRPEHVTTIDKDSYQDRLKEIRAEYNSCLEKIIMLSVDLPKDDLERVEDLKKLKENLKMALITNEQGVKCKIIEFDRVGSEERKKESRTRTDTGCCC
eukprot:GFUD01037623.1.p1 GENE.GFUD01037623.1~~GFUD01037623.1.p1  ORF type:complete len:124 (+),score=37.47 GFUD01037623.1:20-391(+)